jgi:hypothetical protein
LSPTVLRVASLNLAACLIITGCASTPPLEAPAKHLPAFANEAETDDTEEVDGADEYVEICVRKTTLVRTAYQPCEDDEKGYTWWFVPMSGKVPAIGKKPKYGNSDEPSGDRYRAPAKGGKGRSVMTLDDKDRIEICVKKRTRIRFPDSRCDDEDNGYVWYYLLLSRQVPAVGKKATNGSFRESVHSELFRARPSGGKGRKIAITEPDEVPETEDPDVEDPVIDTEPDDMDSHTRRPGRRR